MGSGGVAAGSHFRPRLRHSTRMNNVRHTFLTILQELIAVAVAFVLPLVFWPPAALPFSTAKEWLLGAWVLAGFALALASGAWRLRKIPATAAWAAGIWIVVLSVSAGLSAEVSMHELLIALLACAGFLLLHWVDPRPERIIAALAASGTVMAVIAVLQYFGLDPFRLIGLTGSLQGSSRIRVFSTMGNPNFVAALLTAVLPLTVLPVALAGSGTVPGKWRSWFAVAGVVQACGIFATGSRAPILGFLAAGIWLLMCKTKPSVRFLVPGLIVCAALILFSPARPLGKTIAGRIHIWQIVSRQVTGIPVTGYGPGAFAFRFAGWQAEAGSPNSAAPASFAVVQDHAHNDYLEFLVDLGFIGLLGFGIVIVLLEAFFRPGAGPPEMAAAASLIALLSVAAVDFPLHRPAELYLFWTVSALLSIARSNAGRTRPILSSNLQTIRRTKQCANFAELES